MIRRFRVVLAALAISLPLTVVGGGHDTTASPVPETPYDCERWPPKIRRWQTFGYSLCMNGPGWQRVRIRCYHPQAGEVYIVHGLYVRSHQVNPVNDLSIGWCPAGAFVRRVRIQRLPDLEVTS